MQFDRDLHSKFGELFLEIRGILLKANLQELKRENITSYFCEDGGVCYLKTLKDKVIMGVFKGAFLEDRYPLVNKGQKVIRHLYFTKVKDIDKEVIQNIINDSILINIESKELQKKGKRV